MTSTPLRKRNPTIEDFYFPDDLPTADDLPCSDDKPVDSILQELIPGLLKTILLERWKDRGDWLFGIDLGFYYDPNKPAIAPDGMLCLGIKEYANENMRPSYVLWEERVLPVFILEVVSKTPGKERKEKMAIYESLGILYYLVYAPLLKRKARFQLYKLVAGQYVLQSDGQSPYWMPEVGLGIGMERFTYSYQEREWLFWYGSEGDRLLTPSERADLEAQRADLEAQARLVETQRADLEAQRADLEAQARLAEAQRADQLAAKLRELGIDPNTLE